MNKYENGKIYRIVCNITNKNYYGSTTQPLHKRLYQHKSSYKQYLNGKFNYITSYEIIKEGNFEIILVELFNCLNKMELDKRERFYIENNECVNKYIPTKTTKEHCDINKENKKEYDKQYREDNKNKIKDYQKQYNEANNEEIKEQRKQYREDNKEKIKEQNRKYRENNKDKLKEQRKQYYLNNKNKFN